ncbi:MAG: D-alanyl-D-alanine carboxypeptidase [Bdellovibrionales bacterium]|nr:D-alanyl-D-alanine carboxypeptidase [Bdellovibrionales bacterium]
MWMKLILLFAVLLSLPALGQVNGALVSDFKTMLPKHGISPVAEQTFCYNQTGTVEGYQVDKLQRIASVTKLLSTFAASETLDLNKIFETKFYISGDRLHIAGSRDPYFDEDKLMILMKTLNDLGYKSFKTVTFDKNFHFTDVALQAHQEITVAHTRLRLATYLSSKNIKFVRSKWLIAHEFAKEENVDLDKSITPMINAATVAISEVNPLLDLAPAIYTHKSKPFHAILKSMNVMSKNVVAHNVFLEAGRVKKFATLMAENGIASTSYKIYNGSGLPVKTASSRTDNLASCRMVIKIIELLDQSLAKHNLTLSDIVAINGGKDLGSFRERFLNYPETHEAVISKTGTLMHSSTLAGVLLIDGNVPFAVLNHTTNVSNAKKFQDSFVSRLFHHLGEAPPMIYSKISIFPWDGSTFLELSY